MTLNITKYSNWLRVNLNYFPIALATGLTIFLVRATFADDWDLQFLFYSLIFAISINFFITNFLFLAIKRFLNWENPSWTIFLKYFAVCFFGMAVGVEVAYLALYAFFSIPYFFPHWNDYLFNLIIVLGICSMIYAYNYRIAKEESKLKAKELDLLKLKQLHTQAELDTLQAKINPHFLYNALNSIAVLIKEDADLAESMTMKLSKLFRYSINSTQESLIPLKEELEILNTYLDLERIRFGNRIHISYEIDNALLSYTIPRFLLQPMVENAIKHGLKEKSSDGLLKIKINRVDDKIEIAIEDNGSPFPEQPVVGYGLQSTFDKIELLYGMEAAIHLLNSPIKQVLISIPIKHD